jgi:hypothetical protein
MHHLASLYQAGVDFATSQPDDVLRIQQSLDQVTGMIYARTGLGLGEPYSATLLIHPVTSEVDAMLPPAENVATEVAVPAVAAPAVVAPALPATSASPEPTGEVLEPDLSQLNQAQEVPNEEKAVPVAA